uniref:Transcription initiation factor IIB n=1 Tax=Strigamia maritima TaxID=126957 RepID=T1J3B7_STRMM
MDWMYPPKHQMPVDKYADRNVCRYHPEADVIELHSSGETVCSECGLVIEDRIADESAEWRKFSKDGSSNHSADMCRVGSAHPLLAGNDLFTLIGPPTGAAGFSQNGGAKYKNKRSKTNLGTNDRALLTAFGEIASMANRINLEKIIVDRANSLYKQVLNNTKIMKAKGRNDAVYSSCLYLACRQEEVPRSFKEICAVSNVSKKQIGKCFKLILRALETTVGTVTTDDFMSRFCGNLGLSRAVQRVASSIAKKAVELKIASGKSSISIAAAAIYLACQASADKTTRKEIADVAGVAETTIQQTYGLMFCRVSELFPDDFVFSIPIDKLPRY